MEELLQHYEDGKSTSYENLQQFEPSCLLWSKQELGK